MSNTLTNRRVMVSGCFDMLHSGHIAFLREAATYGELCVAIGSDRTILELKGRPAITSEKERLYCIQSLRCVANACISSGQGFLDFLPELQRFKPDVFFVNEDGDTPAKHAVIEQNNVEYIVSRRKPCDGMVSRSTSGLRQLQTMPYRLDLAGGWLDQPMVSSFCGGAVVNCSIEPQENYQLAGGLASSTRRTAMRLWGPQLIGGDREQLAKMLFACENPPGTIDIAGSQDAIGIVYPGINKLTYHSKYWPDHITTLIEPSAMEFIESHIQIMFTLPRPKSFEVMREKRIDCDGAAALSQAAEACWDAICELDAAALGRAMTSSFEAQVAMFPGMINDDLFKVIESQRSKILGYKIAGAGGGGYVAFVSEKPIEGAGRIKIRREP